MKAKLKQLWQKARAYVRLQWLHFQNRYTPKQRKRIYLVSAALLLLAAGLGGWGYWYERPPQQAERLQTAQSQMMRKQRHHIVDRPHGRYYYDNASGVPSLHEMKRYRSMNPHKYLGHHNYAGDGNKHDEEKTHMPTLRGQVSLPEYGIDVPVFEGTSLSTLAWGAGTAEPDEHMGHGNFAIEAHNFSKLWDADDVCANWFFSNFEKQVAPEGDIALANVHPKVGTEIYALSSKYVYKYVLTRRRIINKNNPSSGILLDRQDEKLDSTNHHTPIITMATCYEQWGILFPDQRIVLTGQLVKKTPRSQFPLHKAFKDV